MCGLGAVAVGLATVAVIDQTGVIRESRLRGKRLESLIAEAGKRPDEEGRARLE